MYNLLIANPECPCCGNIFDYKFYGDKLRHDRAPTIDRFVPTLGYVRDNINIICWRCNVIKRNFTSRELRMVAEWIDKAKSKASFLFLIVDEKYLLW